MAGVKRLLEEHALPWLVAADTPVNEAVYNTGKVPEPNRLRGETFERRRGGVLPGGLKQALRQIPLRRVFPGSG